MEPCEICGTPVNAIFFDRDPMNVCLCMKCIDESRKVDGTLASAFEKVKKIRGMI